MHAVIVLRLHRLTQGLRIKTWLEVSEAGLAKTVGISAGYAGKLLRRLEEHGVIEIERRPGTGESKATSRVKWTEDYQVPLPFYAETMRGYYSVPNAVVDERMKEIVNYASPQAFLCYFVLAADLGEDYLAHASREELARQTGLSSQGVKRAVAGLRACKAAKLSGKTNAGATFLITPNVKTQKPIPKPKVGSQMRDVEREGQVADEGQVGSQMRDIKSKEVLQSNSSTHLTPQGNGSQSGSSGSGESVQKDVCDDVGVADFRSSPEQPEDKSSWDGDAEPDAPEVNATKKVNQLEGVEKPSEKNDHLRNEKETHLKAPPEEKAKVATPHDDEQKSSKAERLKELREKMAARQGEVHYLDKEKLWECSEDFAESVAAALDYRVSAAWVRDQTLVAFDAMQQEWQDYGGMEIEMAETIVKTLGLVVGASLREPIRFPKRYLTGALAKNLKRWRNHEHDDSYDYYNGAPKYGTLETLVDEEISFIPAALGYGSSVVGIELDADGSEAGQDALFSDEDSEDGIPDADDEQGDNRNPDDQVKREPVGDGSQAGAGETFLPTSGRWCMSLFAAGAIARALDGKWSAEKIQNISACAFDLLAAREEQVAREYPEDLAESVIRTFGRVVDAYERGEVRNLRESMREAHEKNIAGEWREKGKGKTTTFVSGGTLYATAYTYGTVHSYIQAEVMVLTTFGGPFYSEDEIA